MIVGSFKIVSGSREGNKCELLFFLLLTRTKAFHKERTPWYLSNHLPHYYLSLRKRRKAVTRDSLSKRFEVNSPNIDTVV